MLGLRADKALSLLPEISSRSRADWLIKNQLVFINGSLAKSSQSIKDSDKIEIFFPASTSSELIPLDFKLEILFEDSELIVLNKPPGMVVHPAAGHAQDTLVNALLKHTKDLSLRFGEQRPGIVHRLDKDTSGILVVAKNDRAHESLARQFKERTIHRIYFAATYGRPASLSGTIYSTLARHPVDRKKFASLIGRDKKIIREKPTSPEVGKWAVTHYTCLKSLSSGVSYFQLKLETGRTHQIRVHLSELGCPIIGDSTYGADKMLNKIKSRPLSELLSTFPRFALHAAELAFDHPKTGARLSFQVDWPQDLQPLLKNAGLI